jgi:hypothetical protein
MLAQHAGISPRTIANAELGKCVFANTAFLLAQALQIDPEVLICHGSERPGNNRETWAWANLASLSTGQSVEIFASNPHAAKMIGLSLLIATVSSLIQRLRAAAPKLLYIRKEIGFERHYDDHVVNNLRRFLNLSLRDIRLSVIDTSGVLQSWPAMVEVVSLVQARIDECNAILDDYQTEGEQTSSKRQIHVKSSEQHARNGDLSLSQFDRMVSNLADAIEGGAEFLQLKLDGMRQDLKQNVLQYHPLDQQQLEAVDKPERESRPRDRFSKRRRH